jgi:hypothetical protein
MRFAVLLFAFLIIGCGGRESQNNGLPFNRILPKINPKVLQADSVVVKKHLYTDLSNTYTYLISFYISYRRAEDVGESTKWKIEVYEKKTGNIVDSVNVETGLFWGEHLNFDEARSYVTGKNKNAEVVDNYYGQFIVADLNFDNKEDFAVMNDIGGNGGSFYTYFIQQDNKKYMKDAFLTDSMTYFPSKIMPTQHMLLTLVHAGAYNVGEHKYVLNTKGEWHQISHRFLGIQ